jgi:hypothetical protein
MKLSFFTRLSMCIQFLFTGCIGNDNIPVGEALVLLGKVSRHESVVPSSLNPTLRAIEERLWQSQHPVTSAKDKFVETVSNAGNNILSFIGRTAGKVAGAAHVAVEAGKSQYAETVK